MTKNKSFIRRVISMFMVIITAVTVCALPCPLSVSAASWPTTSNIKTYCVSTKNDTTVYKTATSTSKYGTIYASDLITIIGVSGNRFYVEYPVKAGTKRGYISKDAVTSAGINYASEVLTAGRKMTAYRRYSGSSTIGSVSKNDRIYKLATKGSRTQVMYPLSKSGYKLGWVNTSELPQSNGGGGSSDSNYVSASEINETASAYGISRSSNAYNALLSINSKYQKKLTSSQKKDTVVFMFEGVGSSSASSKRMNAMCVVVKNGDIVYLNRNSSTIPDYPFDPGKNEGTPMPTIKSGVYSFTTVNHRGKYAALNVSNAPVVRFKSKGSFYDATSYGINVHRRDSNSIAAASAGWVNSAGCLLVGKSGTESSGEYAKFIKAVGIVGSGAKGNSKKTSNVSGKIVVDRAYAASYLKNVGYSSSAINRIG